MITYLNLLNLTILLMVGILAILACADTMDKIGDPNNAVSMIKSLLCFLGIIASLVLIGVGIMKLYEKE